MDSRRSALSRELRLQVGPRLRELRLRHRESQEAVAWAADVTQGSISNYENGRNEVPLSVLISICEYFNTPLNELFTGTIASLELVEFAEQSYPTAAAS